MSTSSFLVIASIHCALCFFISHIRIPLLKLKLFYNILGISALVVVVIIGNEIAVLSTAACRSFQEFPATCEMDMVRPALWHLFLFGLVLDFLLTIIILLERNFEPGGSAMMTMLKLRPPFYWFWWLVVKYSSTAQVCVLAFTQCAQIFLFLVDSLMDFHVTWLVNIFYLVEMSLTVYSFAIGIELPGIMVVRIAEILRQVMNIGDLREHLRTIPDVLPLSSYPSLVESLQMQKMAVRKHVWVQQKSIPIEKELKGRWLSTEILMQIHEKPFALGGMRSAFRAWDLGKSAKSKQYVLKLYKDADYDSYANCAEDVWMQLKAKAFAHAYNSALSAAQRRMECQSLQTHSNSAHHGNHHVRQNRAQPRFIHMLAPFIVEVAYPGSPSYYLAEQYMGGEFVKYNSNVGWVLGRSLDLGATLGGHVQTAQSFTHFTWEASKHTLLVCDIQGVGDYYTDPQIHSVDSTGYGRGNLGIRGISCFFSTHKCNKICTLLQLPRDPDPHGALRLDEHLPDSATPPSGGSSVTTFSHLSPLKRMIARVHHGMTWLLSLPHTALQQLISEGVAWQSVPVVEGPARVEEDREGRGRRRRKSKADRGTGASHGGNAASAKQGGSPPEKKWVPKGKKHRRSPPLP